VCVCVCACVCVCLLISVLYRVCTPGTVSSIAVDTSFDPAEVVALNAHEQLLGACLSTAELYDKLQRLTRKAMALLEVWGA